MFERKFRRGAPEEISQFWDAYVAGQDMAEPPQFAETIHELHQRARTPEPSSDFAANLEATLMQRAIDLGHWPPATSSFPGLGVPPRGARMPYDSRTAPGVWNRSLRMLSAAAWAIAIVAVLVAGSQVWRAQRAGIPPQPLSSLEAVVVATPNVVATPQEEVVLADQLWETPIDANRVLSAPMGVNLDPQGRIWVVDGAEGYLRVFSPDGNLLETWGEAGAGEGQFNFGGLGDIAFAPDGTFYVVDSANHRVQQFAPDRAFIREWDSAGNAGGTLASPSTAALLGKPTDVAVAPDGTVFISDGERNLVEHYSADGNWLDTLGLGGGQDRLNSPGGVAFDAQGNVWVADYGRGRIAVFAPNGSYLQDVAPVNLPTDLAFDDSGRLYVADAQGLQMLDADLRPLGRFWRQEGTFVFLPTVALGPDGRVYSADYNLGFLTAFQLRDPHPAPVADAKPLRITPATP